MKDTIVASLRIIFGGTDKLTIFEPSASGNQVPKGRFLFLCSSVGAFTDSGFDDSMKHQLILTIICHRDVQNVLFTYVVPRPEKATYSSQFDILILLPKKILHKFRSTIFPD